MSDDDFSKTPQTIAELKADKANDARQWTPRDALVALLREIDSGKLDGKMRTVFIAFTREFDNGDLRTGYRCAGPHGLELQGTLARAMYIFNASNESDD